MLIRICKDKWYNFKCWAWKRYTTVKPRTLSHGWADKDTLMLHLMFELLCQFIEDERPEEVSEWRGEHAAYLDNGDLVIDELLYLYKWWNQVYLKTYPAMKERAYNRASKFWAGLNGPATPEWKAEMRKVHTLEAYIKETELKMQKRLVDVSPYMWT